MTGLRTTIMTNDLNFDCKVSLENITLKKLQTVSNANLQNLNLIDIPISHDAISNTRNCSFTFSQNVVPCVTSTTSTSSASLTTTHDNASLCKVCKKTFKGRRGLNIHISRKPNCKRNVPTSSHSIPQNETTSLPHHILEVVKSPSTTIEGLENMCGDGNNTKINKHISKHGCRLCYNISTKDHFVSTSTHRIYQSEIPASIDSLDCNSSNVIYLITCRKCNLQYVGETAQKLRERFNHHTSCFRHPEKDNTCRILSDHFNQGLCKNSTYTVHIIEKIRGSGRRDDGTVDSALTSVRRKKETEWMLKLRTVFPFGLNDRVGDEYMAGRGNTDIASKFPSLKRSGNRYRIRTKSPTSSKFICDNFIYIMNESFRNDLKNSMNLTRVLLSSLKKSFCKRLAEIINDFLANKHDSYIFKQYLIAALDIISSKFKHIFDKGENNKKIPSNRCTIKFRNKAIDTINIQRILRDKEVLNLLPTDIRKDSPTIVFQLSNSIRSKIFNYKTFVQSFDVDSFIDDNNSLPCDCEDSIFINDDHGHIVTGDIDIVDNSKLKNLISKGPKYREPVNISWKDAKEAIMNGINSCIQSWSVKIGQNVDIFKEWADMIRNKIDTKIDILRQNTTSYNIQSCFKDSGVNDCLSHLHDKYVIVPIDKACNNVAFICKRFYASILLNELGLNGQRSPTYDYITDVTSDDIIKSHNDELKQKFNLSIGNNMKLLPDIYWIPKLHKNPIKFRFIIASKYCTIKSLSKNISSVFALFIQQIEEYHNKNRFYSGVKTFWVTHNRNPVLHSVDKINVRKSAKCVSSFDFSTLYTKIPHDKLLEVLSKIIDFTFKGGSKRFIVVSRTGTAYWVDKINTGHKYHFTKDNILDAVSYLLHNCYFKLGNKLFRQCIGIPMGSDPAPFFANLFLFYYESSWLKDVKKSNNILARKFGNVFRYIDDLIALNDGLSFDSYHQEIYPAELELKKENINNTECNFLDMHISIIENTINTTLYDKRNDFGFHITRLPFKSSNIPSRIFYSCVAAEALRVCRITSELDQVILAIKLLLRRMQDQGAAPQMMKKSITKIFRKNNIGNKFNADIDHILNLLFDY